MAALSCSAYGNAQLAPATTTNQELPFEYPGAHFFDPFAASSLPIQGRAYDDAEASDRTSIACWFGTSLGSSLIKDGQGARQWSFLSQRSLARLEPVL